jgi:hypothetical protein
MPQQGSTGSHQWGSDRTLRHLAVRKTSSEPEPLRSERLEWVTRELTLISRVLVC